MDLTDRRTIKVLLEKHGIKPKKHFGQNFLVSRPVLERFIAAAHISQNDTILEIGAGLGTITIELAKRAKKVIAVERDHNLIPALEENIREFANTRIVGGDVRNINVKTYELKTYKLVGNLPFYLTNFIIRRFLESDRPPKDITLIIQKEVAERICARPPHMNLLAVAVQFYGEPKFVSRVPRSAFWPQPEVDAAILRITRGGTVPPRGDCPSSEFFKIVRAGFAHPRKLLISNLHKNLDAEKETIKDIFAKTGIEQNARAENLSMKNWIAVCEIFAKNGILNKKQNERRPQT